ncbi:hypothetical protein PAAG_07763 [Paracoccidioides lutzii Pb01]|uniref:Uncharacterized protein n=1 Tax=Paracoccidioides lutzii (strain ATCC MYA-826 / Pb01) TaxID=502779 RepID=C1HA34_PARBA|nr:hypothetical protein PAAG_07763 [Paracoccidioides lutzii Pb01]EEH37207.2 hypothetical protein PAAG_07763 [Paracoccidioides lutzii Pb01]
MPIQLNPCSSSSSSSSNTITGVSSTFSTSDQRGQQSHSQSQQAQLNTTLTAVPPSDTPRESGNGQLSQEDADRLI